MLRHSTTSYVGQCNPLSHPKVFINLLLAFMSTLLNLSILRGGTSGSVVAARLAEDPRVSVLVIEAGQDNGLLENTKMAGGLVSTVDTIISVLQLQLTGIQCTNLQIC